jgi:hypothetical protein
VTRAEDGGHGGRGPAIVAALDVRYACGRATRPSHDTPETVNLKNTRTIRLELHLTEASPAAVIDISRNVDYSEIGAGQVENSSGAHGSARA